MELPTIDQKRLQRVVADIEDGKPPFRTFEDLCYRVAQSNWASEEGLDAETIGLLMVHHNTITKTKKPQAAAAPAPEPLPTTPPPAPVPAPAAEKPKRTRKPKPPKEEPPAAPEPPKPEPVVEKAPEPVVEQAPEPAPPPAPTPEPEPVVEKAPEPEPAETTEEESPEGTYSEGGPGRKQCPECKQYVGIRKRTCPCGHSFSAADKPQVRHSTIPSSWVRRDQLAAEAASRYGCTSVIAIPAGKPCAMLTKENLTREAIEQWVEEIRDDRKRHDSAFLSMEGVLYWVRNGCHLEGPDYVKVKEHLEDLYPDEF